LWEGAGGGPGGERSDLVFGWWLCGVANGQREEEGAFFWGGGRKRGFGNMEGEHTKWPTTPDAGSAGAPLL